MLYARPEEGFAYLTLGSAHLMLDQIGLGRTWEVVPLAPSLGRGINLQVSVPDLEKPLPPLAASRWPLFMEPEEKLSRCSEDLIIGREYLIGSAMSLLDTSYQAAVAAWTD